MEEILKKINSDILTEAIVTELKEAFDASVNEAVAKEMKEFKSTTLISETEKILDKYDAKFEQFKAQLSESKDKELSEYKSELVESLDSYLELVVEEFLKENKIAIEAEVQVDKANAVLEAFDALLVTTGVEVARIVETKGVKEETISESTEKKLADMEARLDKVIAEKKALEVKNLEMLQLGLKAELCEGLSVVQKEKFNKLADLVEMGADKAEYLKRLETIKESVVSVKEVDKVVQESKTTKVTDIIVESKKVEEKFVANSSRFF